MFIEKFTNIGFVQIGITHPGAGWAIEYKYYPDYFVDKHYTLVVFSHGDTNSEINYDTADYRLYTHHNVTGENVDCVFQLAPDNEWRRNHLNERFREVFKQECREIVIDDLIAEDLFRTVAENIING
jgi:predicted peptidase